MGNLTERQLKKMDETLRDAIYAVANDKEDSVPFDGFYKGAMEIRDYIRVKEAKKEFAGAVKKINNILNEDSEGK